MDAILNAGPVVKLVMLTLIYFSVVSWAIILYKFVSFRRAQNATVRFLDHFWSQRKLDVTARNIKSFLPSPLAGLFREAYNDLYRAKQDDDHMLKQDTQAMLTRTLRRATTVETHKLEKNLSFLATTGSTAPFIGLFGTVWGIMEAFKGIGESGSASLAVVAPGISEALIATAIGLVAAIPAVVAYNHFLTKVNQLAGEMDNFVQDFMTISDKMAD